MPTVADWKSALPERSALPRRAAGGFDRSSSKD